MMIEFQQKLVILSKVGEMVDDGDVVDVVLFVVTSLYIPMLVLGSTV